MAQEIRLAGVKRTRHILSSTNPTAGTTLLTSLLSALPGASSLGKQNALVKLKAKVKRLKQTKNQKAPVPVLDHLMNMD